MNGKKVKQLRKLTKKIAGVEPSKSSFRRIKKDYTQHKIKIKQK